MNDRVKVLLYRGALSVLPVATVALISSFFTRTGDLWYQTLVKPAFTPPQWVFPVAWGIVYVCLMASIYLLLRQPGFDPLRLLVPCVTVGALNIAWSLVFFGLHMILPAVFVLLALLVTLIYLFLLLRPLCRAAAWLLLPHILWGAFAFALNIGFFVLNRM